METPWNKRARLAKEFADKMQLTWESSEQGKQAATGGWLPRATRYIHEVNYTIGLFAYEEPQFPIAAIPTPMYLHDGDETATDRRPSFIEFAREYGKSSRGSYKIPTRLTDYWAKHCVFKGGNNDSNND